MFSFSKKSGGKLNLILDIKSSVVRGTLVLIRPDELPFVAWVSVLEIPYKNGSDSTYLLNETVKAIKKIAEEAHVYLRKNSSSGNSPKKISIIHMVLSSPWIISQARTIDQKFDNDIKISKNHIHDIVRNERAKLTENSSDLTGIEEKIFDVKLNGYSIPSWQGNTAKNLSVSFAISLASKKITQGFINACKEAGLHGSRIDFHSSLLLQHVGLSHILSIQDPYVLIHVHGELTDVVSATSQFCVLFGSYPIGIRAIVREIMNNINVSESAADSSLNLYETKQLDQLHGVSDIKVISDAVQSWKQGCENILTLVPSEYQPLRAIISSRFHEKLFEDILSKMNTKIKVESLPIDKILSLVNFEQLVTERLRTTISYIIALQILETI